MKITFKRALSGLAAIGLSATLLPLLGAGPANAEPGPQPTPTLDPAETPTDFFSFSVDGGVHCDGTGQEGWRAHTFIVEEGRDLSTLDFLAGPLAGWIGFDVDASDGTISSPLWQGNEPQVTLLPGVQPPGFISPDELVGFDLSHPDVGWNIVDGVYQIGFGCEDGSGIVQQWWATTVTIDADASPNPFMIEGAVSEAETPTLDSVTPGHESLAAAFTPGESEPPDTGYTATATPQGGGAAVTATGSGSPITVTGLTNGTTYDVTVRATNDIGDSAESNVLSGTPNNVRPAVQNLSITEQVRQLRVQWNAPEGPVPTGYHVEISPADAPAFDTTSTTATIQGLTEGVEYTVTVTPNHEDPFVGTPASAMGTPDAPAPNPCANPRRGLSGLLNNLGIRGLARALCGLGL